MAHSKHGGRSVKSPHSPKHFDGIETPPIEHSLSDSGPFHGSHPKHYDKHQDHVRDTFHGK